MDNKYGTTFQTMDLKGRTSFPKYLRAFFGDKFVITKGVDKCLAVYSLESFDVFTDKLGALNIEGLDIQRYFLASASEVEPDKQGRILIPQPLREFAALDKELVVVGLTDHAEIWDKTEWMNYNNEKNSPESVKAALKLLGF